MSQYKSYMDGMRKEVTDLYNKVTDQIYVTEDRSELERLMVVEERLNRQSKDMLVALHGVEILRNPCRARLEKPCWECTGYYRRAGRGEMCAPEHPKAIKCRLYTDKPNTLYYDEEDNVKIPKD